MKKNMFARAVVVLVLAMLGVGSAQAAIITFFGDQSGFLAQGVITQFEDFSSCPSGFCFPGDPVTLHDVTYTTTNNLIVGLGTVYGNSVPVFVNNFWTPLPGTINPAPQYDMFGFNLGSLGGTSPMTLSITTNLTTYTFLSLSVPNVSVGLMFAGFVVSPGEYFTSFFLSSDFGPGFAPAITDVSLGTTSTTVPEPSTVLLLGSGLVGLAAWRRRQKAA